MTDIWNEKPDKENPLYTVTMRDNETVFKLEWFLRDMDAWLEKLQRHIEHEWQIEENELRRIIVKRGRKLEAIKPILKQIEQSTNSRPPRVSLEELHLNEQWLRVWKILKHQTSEVKQT